MPNENKEVWAVLAAGGTAGHIFPAVAIAKEAERRGLKVHLISTSRGLGEHIQKEANWGVSFLEGRGFRRKPSPKSIWFNLKALQELFVARRKVRKIFEELKPKIVVSLGGYAGAPCGLAAKSQKVPLILVEPNAVAGMSNKMLKRQAKVVAVGFKECKMPKAVVVGNPVRNEILEVGRAENLDPNQAKDQAKAKLGLSGFVVAVVGGSLGSEKINQTLWEASTYFAKHADLSIYHIVGTRDWETHQTQVQDRTNYKSVPFEDDMASLYEAADLFIARAGAGSIAELLVTGTPSVLIPLPNATGNHQLANAKAISDTGAAALLEEKDLTPEILEAEILKYKANPDLLKEMSVKAKSQARPEAAKAIVDLMEAHANPST